MKRLLGINTNLIAFKNGIYNLNTNRLEESSPDIFITNVIPHNYIVEPLKEEYVDEFLNDISCNNQEIKQTLLELIGYCMTARNNKQLAFILFGGGSNGKTTFINLLEKLLGKENISAQTFEKIINNKYASSCLENKLVNLSSEMTKDFFNDVSIFKNIVTGDRIPSEQKYKDLRDIIPYCKLIFSVNEMPNVADKTEGYYRRLFIIPFNARFSEEKKSKFDFNKLVTKNAMEYLIYTSIQAYLKVKDTMIFTGQAISDGYTKKYKHDNDIILQFLEEEADAIEERIKQFYRVYSCKNLYSMFKDYCEENGYKKMGKKTFINNLENKEVYGKYIVLHKDFHKNQKMFCLINNKEEENAEFPF